jgi:two-component system KDP operon response regulator KdpE
MTTPPTVLVVDDDPAIRRLLRASLLAQGYQCEEARTGQGALDAVAAGGADVVVLDLGLPDLDGMEVIRRLRAASPVPLVVLTSREDERAKVAALDLGADDYVTKPFGIAELMARLRTALRHRLAQEGAPPVFRSGDLMVDLVRRIVAVGGQPVHLSPREYDILALLVKHAGRVLTHRHILGQLWGAGGDVQQLRVYVRQVRQKIETDPERPRHILTETGVGYRLAVEE